MSCKLTSSQEIAGTVGTFVYITQHSICATSVVCPLLGCVVHFVLHMIFSIKPLTALGVQARRQGGFLIARKPPSCCLLVGLSAYHAGPHDVCGYPIRCNMCSIIHVAT